MRSSFFHFLIEFRLRSGNSNYNSFQGICTGNKTTLNTGKQYRHKNQKVETRFRSRCRHPPLTPNRTTTSIPAPLNQNHRTKRPNPRPDCPDKSETPCPDEFVMPKSAMCPTCRASSRQSTSFRTAQSSVGSPRAIHWCLGSVSPSRGKNRQVVFPAAANSAGSM